MNNGLDSMTTKNLRSAHLELAHDAGAPRAARHFVIGLLERWGLPADAVERCQLLVSELVSNAVLHGHEPIELAITEIDSTRGIYRVEVCNGGEKPLALRRARATDVSGRGLRLVDKLSRGWGSYTVDGTTRVWFELHTAS